MIIEHVESLETADGKTARVVFSIGRSVYAVVKVFDTTVSGKPRTVKFWELTTAGYARTKSHWSTTLPRVSSPREISEALNLVQHFGSFLHEGFPHG